MLLKLECGLESHRSQNFWFLSSGQRRGLLISNKFPSGVDAPGPGTTFENDCPRVPSILPFLPGYPRVGGRAMVPRNELWLFLEEPPSASKQVNPHNGPTYNCGHLFFFFSLVYFLSVYWDVIDIQHHIRLRYSIMIWLIYIMKRWSQ